MSNELTAMQQYTAVLSDCISSQEKWLAFLDFAADFSMSESQMKHGFSTQIGVYGSPLRSAVCLTEDDWAKRLDVSRPTLDKMIARFEKKL